MNSHQASTGSIPEEVLQDLLESPRRCHLLAHLADADDEKVLTDLAAAVAAAEEGCEPGSVGDEKRCSVREDLFERHLAKLTAIGIVEYDSMLGTVSLARPSVAAQAAERLSGEEVSKDK